MNRGTTPTLTFTFDEIDHSTIVVAELTIQQNYKNVIVRNLEKSNDIFYINLSQEDTLKFSNGICRLQVKFKLNDGNVVVTDILQLSVTDILHAEVMS